MNIKKFITISLLCTILFSCTEKFYPLVEEDISILVVDGQITDEYNSCEVRLFRTVNYTEDYELKPETGALVILFNDIGDRIVLHEKRAGVYQPTNSLKADIGQSYWIEVETLSGERYESSPEYLHPQIELESIYGEEVDEIANKDVSKQGVKFYFDTKQETDLAGNYLRWKYRESYEWHSPFKSSKTVSPNPSQICYPVNHFNNINVFDASNFSIKEIDHLPISTVFNNEVKLLHNYLIDLKVYSISQQNYIFWKNIKAIHQTNGSLYDVIPANILGNIFACSDSCRVFGYFEVSSVNTSQKTFNQNDFNIEFADFPEECKEFTMTLEDNLKPDRSKYYIISKDVKSYAIRYTIRLIECYECNMKYPVNKPSFWP